MPSVQSVNYCLMILIWGIWLTRIICRETWTSAASSRNSPNHKCHISMHSLTLVSATRLHACLSCTQ